MDGFYGARTAAAITNWRRRLSEERRDQWKTSFTRGGLAAAAAAAAVERDVGEDLHVQHLVDDGGGDGGRGVVIGGGEERKGDRLDGRKFPNFPPMAKISSATFELPSSVSPNESPSSTRAVSTETPPQEEIETEAVGASLWPTLIQPLSVGARGDAVRALQALLLHGYVQFLLPHRIHSRSPQARRHATYSRPSPQRNPNPSFAGTATTTSERMATLGRKQSTP